MTVPSLEGIRVLLADDHATVRMGFRLLLEGAGATIIGEADSGEAAVSAFDRSPPDVLMMDVSMPGIGGLGGVLEVGVDAARPRPPPGCPRADPVRA